MKDTTINYSSRPSTPSRVPQLIIVTGKGGVGKTTLSYALCRSLISQGRKAVYNSFDHHPNWEILKKLEIPALWHSTDESAEMYVSQKLGSATIGKWVMKAPFFHALYNMLPGLSSVILLGHLIKHLEDDPELTLVIDSPSSGHVKMMLESPQNFKEMFGIGLIVQDIERMQKFLSTKGNVATLVTCLPTQMAMTEGIELREDLEKLGFGKIHTVVNDSYTKQFEIHGQTLENLPTFIFEKLKVEKTILDQTKDSYETVIPHFNGLSIEQYIAEASQSIGQLDLGES